MPGLSLAARGGSRRIVKLSYLVSWWLGAPEARSWAVSSLLSRCKSMPPLTRRQASTVSPVVVLSDRGLSSALYATNSDNEEATKKQPRKRRQSAVTEDQTVKEEPTTPSSTAKATTATKPPSPAKKRKKTTVAVERKPPKDWEKTYSLVEELRMDRTAPVDSDGGHALPQRELGDVVYRFQLLIALMLSSQTKDAVVGDTMRALQEYGLTMENIASTPHEKLNQLIGKVGFHNNKTKYIKQAVEICLKDHGGDIPDNATDLMKLPGVGPKMAFIIEGIAYNKHSGIGVDTHMHRMYNQLQWVKSKNPEQTRVQLQSWLPESKWPTVNVLWVGFGQEVQQFKPKILRKALDCSRPMDALRLLRRLGFDVKKEGQKQGWEQEIKKVMKST